jgi:hypothetical protein
LVLGSLFTHVRYEPFYYLKYTVPNILLFVNIKH